MQRLSVPSPANSRACDIIAKNNGGAPMSETGWELWGLKFHWFIVVILVIFLTLVIVFVKKKMAPKNIDKKAGDEGEE